MPTMCEAVRAMRWLSSVVNSFAIEDSAFGISPASCIEMMR